MILETLKKPDDIKQLSLSQLNMLATEARDRIVKVVSKTGGHLASSLGTVDLIIALHYCLNLPKDKIIFDVGHQAYCHKLLTMRNKDFDSLRQYNGLSGFPSKNESEYDSFTTGHSSTAVSMALGLICAQELLQKKERSQVVAMIGDGSLSGGLCFEGLNNAGHSKKDILVILNTNEMSISPNVGALSTYINKFISLPIYNRFRNSVEHFVESRLPKGKRLIKLVDKFEEGLKGLFVPGMFFEELGFRYFGPFDGHNLELLISTFKNVLSLPGPRFLHVVTQKGRGYPPAEKNPVKFHSAAPFEIATGKNKSKAPANAAPSYTAVFGKKLLELAKQDKKIVAITAAMPEGTGLDKFRDAFPERFFDVGIAESHAVCFAAGLAKSGFKPVTAIYSTFLQRAYDQIIENVALQELPVILAIDRAGIVGQDGVTHQGTMDIAYLRNIPNLVVMAPADGRELEAMLKFALDSKQPIAFRYPRAESAALSVPITPVKSGKAQVLREGKDVAIFALGSMVEPALKAAEILEGKGIKACVVNSRFVKPLDAELFKNIASKVKTICTIEEGMLEGGFGDAVRQSLNQPVHSLGLPCEFIVHGKRDLLLEKHGLSAEAIAKSIIKLGTGP